MAGDSINRFALSEQWRLLQPHSPNSRHTPGPAKRNPNASQSSTQLPAKSSQPIQAGDAETVDQAIQASQKAFLQWRQLSPTERSQYLFRCAAELVSHTDEIATLLRIENGKPFKDARAGDVFFLYSIFRFFGSLVDKLPSQFYDRGVTYATVVHEPLEPVRAFYRSTGLQSIVVGSWRRVLPRGIR